MRAKNILLFMFLWFFITNITARDATNIQRVVINLASVQTKADEALQIAIESSNTVATVKQSAENAEAMAQGTVDSLVNPAGCVYDTAFACTEANLNHTYQIISWTTPGNHSWAVPSGITQIYVIVKGNDGGGYIGNIQGDDWFSDCPVNSFNGNDSSLAINSNTITSNGGNGAQGIFNYDDCSSNIDKTLALIMTSYINVSVGETANITVGGIGSSVNSLSYLNKDGQTGYVTIKY